MVEPETNRLMRRVLRFIHYNSELYIRFRQHGDYPAAVQRLARVSKLIGVADQAEREGKSQLSSMDWATLTLARHHSDMVFERQNP